MIRALKSPSSPVADTCNIFFVTKTGYSYEKNLIVAILQLATSLSYAEEVDPNIAHIQNSFEAYLKE